MTVLVTQERALSKRVGRASQPARRVMLGTRGLDQGVATQGSATSRLIFLSHLSVPLGLDDLTMLSYLLRRRREDLMLGQ